MENYLIKATGFDGMVRAYTSTTTGVVEEARKRHDSWATATAALGRTMTITAMMGAMLKGDDTITAKIEGGGPLGGIVVDANATGDVRGYVQQPQTDFPTNSFGKLDVARAVGTEGTLSIVKDVGLKDYFTGQVQLVSGEISEDFTYYFAHSEQVPSAVGAGVLVNPDHSVLAAGGFIVQMMPGATDEVITQVEENITNMPAISESIQAGKTPAELLDLLFGEAPYSILEQVPIQFTCTCSKERFERAIVGLGVDEIKAMIDEDKGAEAQCHFCNETYHFTEEELRHCLEETKNK
ncbi:MAG TPA: Hsp33 family molecular chaperone HslO [Bacillota bacterium]|nr:Hsp33 family molecular chaperone HslO [Bacillota bacterium]